ncbi:MAG: hypothetical protein HRF49_11615 [bacterium]
MKGKGAWWLVLPGILILVAVIAGTMYAGGAKKPASNPDFGSKMGSFAGTLKVSGKYACVGNMETETYYMWGDPRIEQIPEDKRVYFSTEKDARDDFGYKKG